ncbi:MAG: hypothetical protein V5A45_14625 [Haloarculaceae archaeon]
MPIDTNSEVWQSTDRAGSTRTEILEFFKDNPDKAYTVNEISQEILGVDVFEVPDVDGEIGEILGEVTVQQANKSMYEAFVKSHLSALVYAGEIIGKPIPNEALDNDVSDGKTSVYSYSPSTSP